MSRRFALVLLAALAAGSAHAQDATDGLTGSAILPGWRAGDGTRIAALHLSLAPGWKTYWRSPGEAGIPPRFDWAGSTNVAGVVFRWPAPQIFDLNGLRVLGYKGEVILPMEVTPRDPAAPVRLSGTVDIGVCEEICVPVSLTFATDLPADGARDPAILAALRAEPPRISAATTCAVEPVRDGLRLTAEMATPPLGADEFAVIEIAGSDVWVSPAETMRDGGRLRLTADLVPPDAAPFAFDRSALRVTLFGGGRSAELRGCTG